MDKERVQQYLGAIAMAGVEEALPKKSAFDRCEVKTAAGEDEVKVVKTCCRACIANCGVLAYVKNGRVIKLEGNNEDPMS